jgi:hypothetical protein
MRAGIEHGMQSWVKMFFQLSTSFHYSTAKQFHYGPRFGTPIWDPDLVGDMGPRFGTLILGGDMGPPFGTLIWGVIWGVIWDPDLGPWFGG